MKINVVKTIASNGKQSAEPIDANFDKRITVPSSSARLERHASTASDNEGHRLNIVLTS